MQEIIVYRNPVEAAMWNVLSTGSGLTIFLAVIGLGFMWVFLYGKLEEPMRKKFGYFVGTKYATWVCNLIVAITAVGLHFYNIYG